MAENVAEASIELWDITDVPLSGWFRFLHQKNKWHRISEIDTDYLIGNGDKVDRTWAVKIDRQWWTAENLANLCEWMPANGGEIRPCHSPRQKAKQTVAAPPMGDMKAPESPVPPEPTATPGGGKAESKADVKPKG